ncbi:hypothetical protein EV696_102193 [Permianibacter aggregans]|uniref:Uncharacterized protein n=1 Tax=Permianibacter aggregans TaxID=1510150 RepID=A0A4R6UTL2_9GAMM|nr:hypothetical protein EV696_102193 [Permianibacter aggregans]
MRIVRHIHVAHPSGYAKIRSWRIFPSTAFAQIAELQAFLRWLLGSRLRGNDGLTIFAVFSTSFELISGLSTQKTCAFFILEESYFPLLVRPAYKDKRVGQSVCLALVGQTCSSQGYVSLAHSAARENRRIVCSHRCSISSIMRPTNALPTKSLALPA